MPSPSTTQLPRPKSWDELEDICTDILKRLWDNPYVTRNGRSGQAQGGVDIYGTRESVKAASRRFSAAQCKCTESLTMKQVVAEVEKAKQFKPALREFVLMTTCSRDANLQATVRKHKWPFPVQVMFWEDISLELSGHADLLKKHFPGWVSGITSSYDVVGLVMASKPDDYEYADERRTLILS